MDTEGQELGPYEPVPDALALAAIERAIRHGAEDTWIAEVGEHLGFQRSPHTTRRLRQQLERLRVHGWAASRERHGREYWRLTARLVPCPLTVEKTYTLDTAAAPFKEGLNTVQVCAHDYAQTGTPNGVCESHEVLVNNLCPGSPVAGGKTITAGFAGNKGKDRTLPFRRTALVRGRLLDANGQPVAGAQVCIQAHTDLPGRPFHLVATTTTNQNGGWSYKTNRGPSRIFRVGYRSGAFEVAETLALRIRSRSTLHLNTHRTPFGKKVYFSGELPDPSCAGRTAYVKMTVRGASRKILVRQATTDPLCHFRIGYAFAKVTSPRDSSSGCSFPSRRATPMSPADQ